MNDKLRVLEQVAAGAADGFSTMAAASGGGREEAGGALVWHSPSSVPVFNAAGLFSADLITQSTLDAVAGYFQRHARPYSVLILDDLVPGAAESLADLGYDRIDSMPAMWLDSIRSYLEQPARTDNTDIEVRQVQSQSDMALFRSILSQVFGMHPREVEIILTERAFQTHGMRHYLAWQGATTVGVTSLVLERGIAGIWNVGTLPEQRRRGVALAMMQHALTDAAGEGCNTSMLLASAAGLPLYEHMGYSTVSTLRVYVPLVAPHHASP